MGRTTAAAFGGYSLGEEIANAVTHGIATALAIAGLVVLVVEAVSVSGTALVVTSAAVFGAAMVLLYLASTLYHAIPGRRAKRWLQMFDHGAIYLLIAGSYTPFCLVTLGGPTGMVLFGFVWAVSLAGMILQPVLLKRAEWLNCVLYLGLGWAVVWVFPTLIDSLPSGGLWLLAGGGAAYSLGVIFYLWDRLPFNHAVWHLFVLAGTTLQFFSVLLYVIPGA